MNHISPTSAEQLSRIRSDLRIGLMVNFGEIAFTSIEALSETRFRALREMGDVFVAISQQRALDLGISWDPSRDFAFKLPKDYRFGVLKALADPSLDLDYPGKGPLVPAEIEQSSITNMLQLCRTARLLPAVIFVYKTLDDVAVLSQNLVAEFENSAPILEKLAHARVPLEEASNTQLHVYRNLQDDSEHCALIIGKEIGSNPLVRLHSACFTGDCLGSLKCDCGPQLHHALNVMNREGGVLIYLSQEGRGIGLPNKIRAYHLQDQGYDTVEANLRLGFQDDERDFRVGAEILKKLKIQKLRLMTNNPRKIQWLERNGLEVTERVEVKIDAGDENRNYLHTKATKSGHML